MSNHDTIAKFWKMHLMLQLLTNMLWNITGIHTTLPGTPEYLMDCPLCYSPTHSTQSRLSVEHGNMQYNVQSKTLPECIGLCNQCFSNNQNSSSNRNPFRECWGSRKKHYLLLYLKKRTDLDKTDLDIFYFFPQHPGFCETLLFAADY